MTNTWQAATHLLFGLAGAVIGAVLVVTGHLDGATGVALVLGSLGMGTTAAVGVAGQQTAPGGPQAVLPSNTVAAPDPASPSTPAPAGLGSLHGTGVATTL